MCHTQERSKNEFNILYTSTNERMIHQMRKTSASNTPFWYLFFFFIKDEGSRFVWRQNTNVVYKIDMNGIMVLFFFFHNKRCSMRLHIIICIWCCCCCLMHLYVRWWFISIQNQFTEMVVFKWKMFFAIFVCI